MADYRQIHVCIWKDSWFLELPADHKLLFIYLFSNERACLAGLYDLSLKVIAFETELPAETIADGLERFAQDGKAFYEDGMVWVPTLLKHNAQNVTSPKIQAHLKSSLAMIRDCPLKDRWIEYYNQQIPYQYRMDTRSETEKEQEQEQEQEHEQEKEQDQTEDGASAPPANAGQGGNGHPSTFQEWQEAIRESKNRPAVLRLMCEILYPGLSPPSYGYIGKVARKVGGAGRLADLLWQCTPHPPTGDLMAYIQKVAQNGKHGTKPERQTQEPAGVTGWTDS